MTEPLGGFRGPVVEGFPWISEAAGGSRSPSEDFVDLSSKVIRGFRRPPEVNGAPRRISWICRRLFSVDFGGRRRLTEPLGGFRESVVEGVRLFLEVARF